MRNQLYEIELGIFDHTNPELVKKDPLAVIRAKPEESLIQSSHLWDIAKRYREARIKDRFGITFPEYADLPLPVSALYDRLSIEVFGKGELEDIKIRAAAQEDAQRAAEALANSAGKKP